MNLTLAVVTATLNSTPTFLAIQYLVLLLYCCFLARSSDSTARLWKLDGSPVIVLPHESNLNSADSNRDVTTVCWNVSIHTHK